MIGIRQVVIGVVCGSALMLLGLLPGLFQQLVEGVRNAPAAFGLDTPAHARERVETPRWLAPVGAGMIVATALLYSPPL